MPTQQYTLKLVERTLHRVGLFQNIDAILVVLDHFADGFQMALDIGQALDRVFLGRLVTFHWLLASFTTHTPPEGVHIQIISQITVPVNSKAWYNRSDFSRSFL